VGTFRPVRAVELLLVAGALLTACAVTLARRRRRRRARGLPGEIARLLEAVPGPLGDAVLVLDAAGRITRVNAATTLLVAAPPEDVVGKPLSVLGPDLLVLARGLARGPVAAPVTLAARNGPRRARAALFRVGGGVDVVVLRPEPAPRPPPLPRRAASAPGPAPAPEPAIAAAAAAVREPLGRAARAASLLRLSAPPLGLRAGGALAALEEALADAEHRVSALASIARPGAPRPLDLVALVDEVVTAFRAPGVRVRSELAPAHASGDDRALRAALREVLRSLAVALPAGEEILVSVHGGTEPLVELAAAAAPARGDVAATARALLGPQAVRVEEETAAGHGWRLRVVLPPVAALHPAASDAAFV
jgi:signal transduction histidine kinase